MVVEPVVEVIVVPPEVMIATSGEVVIAVAGTVVALAVLDEPPFTPPGGTTTLVVTVAVLVALFEAIDPEAEDIAAYAEPTGRSVSLCPTFRMLVRLTRSGRASSSSREDSLGSTWLQGLLAVGSTKSDDSVGILSIRTSLVGAVANTVGKVHLGAVASDITSSAAELSLGNVDHVGNASLLVIVSE